MPLETRLGDCRYSDRKLEGRSWGQGSGAEKQLPSPEHTVVRAQRPPCWEEVAIAPSMNRNQGFFENG